MTDPGQHYIECTDLDCAGCLPSDADVEALSVGGAVKESMRRGMDRVRAVEAKAAILADADEYRARSVVARSLL